VWVATAVLLALGGTAGAVFAAASAGNNAQRDSHRAFATLSADITSTLQLAIQHENDLVVSAGSYFLSIPSAANSDFRSWSLSMRAFERYPELQGIGITTVVESSQLSAFATKAVADPAGPLAADGTFQVVPPGSRPFYCLPVVGQNRVAGQGPPAGFDFCASDSGSLLFGIRDSGQDVNVPLKIGENTLLNVSIPVYLGGSVPTTVEARRAAFVGWVGLVTLPKVLLDRALQGHPGAAVSMRYQAGSSDVTFGSSAPVKGAQATMIDLHDGWTVTTFGTVAAGGVFANGTSIALLVSGIALSLLLALLVLILSTGRARALRLVRERTVELRGAQAQLVDTARQAGMAEVATNVLHNVGNVLNSVNVSANLASQTVRGSKSAGLSKAVDLIHEHSDDLGVFLTTDERGKTLPGYLEKLAATLRTERESVEEELQRLTKGVNHIKEIVAAQQSLAGISGVTESVRASDLADEALRMAGIRDDGEVILTLDFGADPLLTLDRHRVLLVLLNLIGNSIHAMTGNLDRPRRLSVQSDLTEGQRVSITVSDNGVGIPPENLTRIFVHGFTTHAGGHGFGLHSSAIAATEIGGALTVHSDGAGTGAAFTLQVPLHAPVQPEPVPV
jgi:signal transduction histidine kinase